MYHQYRRALRRPIIFLLGLGPLVWLILLTHLPAQSLAANGIPTPRALSPLTGTVVPSGLSQAGGPAQLPAARSDQPSVSSSPSAVGQAPNPRAGGVLPTATSDPGHQHDDCSGTDWHPPTDHEHGDAPPAWIMAAGYNVCFSGAFSTSSLENTAKHAAMKGFSFPNVAGTGQDLYMRVHAASNPGDRSGRYHSYEWWIRGTDGKVSHASGWYDTGDPTAYDPQTNSNGARVDRDVYGDPLVRPAILVTTRGDLCEQWYARPGQAAWMADFGWTICGSTTLYTATEDANPDVYNAATWPATGSLGLTRRLEFAWYGWRASLRGDFYTDQFGQTLSGPNDPRVGTSVVKYGKSYTVVALKQHLEPTLQTIAYPGASGVGNALQKNYVCPTSCHLPN